MISAEMNLIDQRNNKKVLNESNKKKITEIKSSNWKYINEWK